MRSILSNAVWSTVNILLAKGIRFFAVAYCIRLLGTHTWGQIAATMVTVSFLYFVVDMGLGSIPALHRVAERSLDVPFLRRITFMRLALAAVLVAGIRAAAALGAPIDPLVALYSLALLPRAANLDWWFQRREMYHVTTAIQSLRLAGFAAAALVAVDPGDGAGIVLWLDMGSEILATAAAWVLMRRHARSKAPAAPGAAELPAPGYAELARLGFPLFLMGGLTAIHQSVDVLFLKAMCGYSSVGEYDVGYRIGFFLYFIGASVILSIRPKLSRLHAAGDHETMRSILESCSKLLASAACVFLVVSFYFSDSIISLLFRDEGDLTRFVFRWAPVWILTSFMTILCADTLLCMGQRRKYMIGAGLCAAVNLAGNYVLIKAFGERGAIFATILAEAVFFAYAFAALPVGLRRGLSGRLASQAAMGALLVLAFLASAHWGSPTIGLSGSLIVLAAFVYGQGAFRKGNLAVLAKN